MRVISGIPDSERLASERHLSFLATPFTASSFIQPVQEVLRAKHPPGSEVVPQKEQIAG